MAAVPFKGVIQTVDGNGNAGPTFAFSASDVVNAFCTFDDLPGTPSFVQFPAGLYLGDIQISAAGSDTKRLVVVKGVATTDKILRDAPLVETLAGMDGKSRLGALYKTALQPGIQYALKQLA